MGCDLKIDGSSSDSWFEELLKNAPAQGDYWFVSDLHCENPPVVHLLEHDNQVFEIPGQEPERMRGWKIEVIHTGKQLFLPNRLLGSKANAMEVIAWAAV